MHSFKDLGIYKMDFGCLQDIVVKLIIFKSARYKIIWNKISYYFQILCGMTLLVLTFGSKHGLGAQKDCLISH
jgi:hypothetical protein